MDYRQILRNSPFTGRRPCIFEKHIISNGIEFGLTEDCVAAMMRLACDQSVNGGLCTASARDFGQTVARSAEIQGLMCVRDAGHSFAIIGRSIAKEGFVDAEQDDWTRGEYWADLQKAVINAFGG